MTFTSFCIFYFIVVSGKNCTDTVGSLNIDSSIIIQEDSTFLLTEYIVPCTGIVIAWEFCYRVVNQNSSVSFNPGIWSNGSDTSFKLVQSSNVSFIPSGDINSCQTVSLSETDQFTAPAGSVVGLYSNKNDMRSQLLGTNNTGSTYIFTIGNFTDVKTNRAIELNHSIAIRLHLS